MVCSPIVTHRGGGGGGVGGCSSQDYSTFTSMSPRQRSQLHRGTEPPETVTATVHPAGQITLVIMSSTQPPTNNPPHLRKVQLCTCELPSSLECVSSECGRKLEKLVRCQQMQGEHVNGTMKPQASCCEATKPRPQTHLNILACASDWRNSFCS